MAQPTRDRQPDQPVPRRARAEAVGADASLAARTAFSRAGFADPTLVLRWQEIAGEATARLARPVRLKEGPAGGVLTLRAEPGAALFLQHESRALCARINAYLGSHAVTGLRFVQGPLATRSLPVPPAGPGPVASDDPVRAFHGPERLGSALLRLAGRRTVR